MGLEADDKRCGERPVATAADDEGRLRRETEVPRSRCPCTEPGREATPGDIITGEARPGGVTIDWASLSSCAGLAVLACRRGDVENAPEDREDSDELYPEDGPEAPLRDDADPEERLVLPELVERDRRS